MFIERKVNEASGAVELWECRWETATGPGAKKVYVSKIGPEPSVVPADDAGLANVKAVIWSNGRTLGNIAAFSENVSGHFPGSEGNDAELPCDMVNAGKFRHGAARWWCRTHQKHWGVKADHAAWAEDKVMRCSNASQKLSYTLNPFEVDVGDHYMVGIWCSLPPGLASSAISRRAPKIHVHVRKRSDGKKVVDRDFDAVSLVYNQDLGLFADSQITRVNITPPAAIDFLLAQEEERDVSCIDCKNCKFPHLDLGSFARKPHRKHLCGNCGNDAIWSKDPIVSNPLKPLHDSLAKDATYVSPGRSLDLDRYADHDYEVWASTPAIVWTADRPQEKGIHVHVTKDGTRVVDDTFSAVTLRSRPLDRSEVFAQMVEHAVI